MKNNLSAAKEIMNVGLAHLVHAVSTEIRLSADMVKRELREDMKGMESRIIDHLDSFLAEIKTSREEREIVSYRLSDHEERITALETGFSVPAPT